MLRTYDLHPDGDGVDHINIYSRGRTELGRLLSNFARTPFTHPEYGHFESVEGFWYWWFGGCSHDVLRNLWGSEAKYHGRKLVGEKYSVSEEDRKVVLDVVRHKIMTHQEILWGLVESELPLEHYYTYSWSGKSSVFVKDLPEHRWFVEGIEAIREYLKK